MDIAPKIKSIWTTLSNHERYQSVTVVTVIVIIVILYGCTPKCASIINPDRQITRDQLNIELDELNARITNAYTDLDRKEQLQRLIADQTIKGLTTGTIDPLGLITSAIAVLGIGAAADNVRKRRSIRKLEQRLCSSESPTQPTTNQSA